MKISIGLYALLLAILFSASSCATLSYPMGDVTERTNWREYEDC
jgi:hypothetical protein